jgi:predicted ATPase
MSREPSAGNGHRPPCPCRGGHAARRIVLTGGPGAGKTALLELIRRTFCQHVHVLPESAGILFGGGFPRGPSLPLRRATQRAIFYVQHELEASAAAGDHALVVCDRGTLDGAAYWPGPDDLFSSVGSSLAAELARYDAVIHLRTPPAHNGYNHDNPLRLESADEAAEIDAKLAVIWASHPRRFEIAVADDFLAKATRALEVVRGLLPPCCGGAAAAG